MRKWRKSHIFQGILRNDPDDALIVQWTGFRLRAWFPSRECRFKSCLRQLTGQRLRATEVVAFFRQAGSGQAGGTTTFRRSCWYSFPTLPGLEMSNNRISQPTKTATTITWLSGGRSIRTRSLWAIPGCLCWRNRRSIESVSVLVFGVTCYRENGVGSMLSCSGFPPFLASSRPSSSRRKPLWPGSRNNGMALREAAIPSEEMRCGFY
jgi:hypothetical protein